MAKSKTILIVDDEEFIRLNLKQILKGESYDVNLKETGQTALKTLHDEEIDLVLLDLNLPDMNGIEILKQMKLLRPELLIIIMTGFASVESAVEAIKHGAYDYIKKPFKADAIKLIVKLAFETLHLKSTVKKLKEQQIKKGIESLVGESPSISEIKNQILEYAKHDYETVLITGESGTGKELVASALHNLSKRESKDFVEINCASIPDTLLESELFGYERGAFTDAKQNKSGLFEKAEGGTLFLDEIGEMSLTLQAKLLRVIEDKKFRKLGSTNDIEVNVRIIAATNKLLKEAISQKEFREDLYYRLNVLRIKLPPLRERGKDVLILAEHFLHHFNKKFNKTILGFSEKSQKFLFEYNWPGNIRELKNIIERICILQNEQIITPNHLPSEWVNDQLSEAAENSIVDFNNSSLEEILQTTEINLLKKAYSESGNNAAKTARLLKIPRETLRYKLEKYKINNGEF